MGYKVGNIKDRIKDTEPRYQTICQFYILHKLLSGIVLIPDRVSMRSRVQKHVFFETSETPAVRLFGRERRLGAPVHIEMPSKNEYQLHMPYCYYGGREAIISSVCIRMYSYSSITNPYAPICIHTPP